MYSITKCAEKQCA